MPTDTLEFTEYYQAHFGHLVAQMYAVTGNLSEAQDCAQEAFVRAWPRWETVRHYDNPAAWLYRVGYRVAVSRWRKIVRTRTALPDDLDSGLAGPGPETISLVDALRQLPAAQARALVLHHMVGLTVAEIADEEHVAVGTIKARLSRGRVALSEHLTDDFEPTRGERGTGHA